jgi:X-Pro dipeptidyl-peptidase
MQPTDEFIPAGKRLALVVMSSDQQFTLWPLPGTELTLDLSGSSISVPVVGGKAALTKAGVK